LKVSNGYSEAMVFIKQGYVNWATGWLLAIAYSTHGAVADEHMLSESVDKGTVEIAQSETAYSILADSSVEPSHAIKTQNNEEAVYREALYHYFLKDYGAAFGVLGRHATNIFENSSTTDTSSQRIQRLTAGVALAYGMHDMAHRRLLVLLDDPQQRDVANYYLALLAYRQGDLDQTQIHLDAMNATPQQLINVSDVALLRADVALQVGNPALAGLALEQLPMGSRDYLLTALNIANYHSREGDFIQAREYYRKLDSSQQSNRRWLPDWRWPTLGWLKSNDSQWLSVSAGVASNRNAAVEAMVSADSVRQDNEWLINRARLAAGYAALDAGLANEAEQWLMAIPQNSIGARQAILGYGWSQYERGDFNGALDAWLALSTTPQVAGQATPRFASQLSPRDSPQATEASLGVALVYAKLLRPRMALDQYQRLVADLELQLASISSLLVGDRLLVDDADPMQRYLHAWQSSDAFSLQMDRRLALNTLAIQSQGWLEKLEVYTAALHDKGQLRLQQAGLLTNAGFYQRVNDLELKLDLIKVNHDLVSVSSSAQYKLRQRVFKARSDWQSLVDTRARLLSREAYKAAVDGADVEFLVPSLERMDQADKALQLYQGMLDWSASEGWHDALWQLEKRRSQTAIGLAAAKKRQASIAHLLEESADITPLLEKIQTRQTELLAQLNQLNRHIVTINTGLLAAQRAALRAQQNVVKSQLAQIHFNMGTAYDQFSLQALQRVPNRVSLGASESNNDRVAQP
jgi:hypothetical protein